MPTKIGIISDVDADVHALRDALKVMENLGCSLVVCGGDLVDRGFFPEETIALLREREIICVRGNHDRWASSDDYRELRQLSGSDLSDNARDFLARLPESWTANIGGVQIALHHASPGSDMRGIDPATSSADEMRGWLRAASADVLLVGHTHVAFAAVVDGGLIANPGALLRFEQAAAESPVEGGGTFAVLEIPSRKFTVYCLPCSIELEVPRYEW